MMSDSTRIGRRMRRVGFGLLVLAGLTVGLAVPAQAQRPPSNISVGAQIGAPTGVSVGIYGSRAFAYDVLAAWDLDDFFYLNVHGIYDRAIADPPGTALFYGPGVFLGLRDRKPNDDEVALGVSGTFGLRYRYERLEFYARLTPRLALLEETDVDIGGGLGIRFFL